MTGLWRHIAGGLDPTKLAAQLGMECDPWQRQVLRSNASRVHINCARQTGKSTTVSIAAMGRAVYRPGSLVLIVSPTQRQSSELFRQVLVRYRQLGRPIESESENQLSLTLENGSRVISAPGSEAGIRTYSVDLLLIDEASRVDDEVFNSLSPMVAVTKGRIIATSTPMGRRGWWYEASLSRHWEHVVVPATECPRISPDFLEDSKNLQIRSGVGVRKDGTIVFAISRLQVNFYTFASLFLEDLRCPNALYLDGTISAFYVPGKNDTVPHSFGPMIGVVEKAK